MNWVETFVVFVGGGIGSVLRYAVGLCIGSAAFPWATLAVNVGGSLAIGLFGGWSERFGWTEAVRLALTVGLCGGFTTFSTFSKESLALAQSGRWGAFAAYTLGSVAIGLAAVAAGFTLTTSNSNTGTADMNDAIYQFTVKDCAGGEVSLKDYAGKVLLIVNTATRCGFTPQYDGLEAMYERLKGRGFELLDFPCNQFGQQAPGTDEEIHGFCVLNYKTAFPQFAKVEVNGENAAPLFRYLVANTTFGGFPQDGKLAPILEKMLGEADPDYAKKPDIKWNFTKFLVGKDGKVVRRFEPTAPLAEVESAIEAELSK